VSAASEPDYPKLLRVLLTSLRGRQQLDPGEVEPALRRMIETCRATWPKVKLSPELFVRHVAAKLARSPEPIAELSRLRAAELYLALACVHAEDPGAAIAELDRRYLARVGDAVRSVDPSAAFLDDVKQRLREKLLLPRTGREPALLGYSGTGPLSSWIKAAAVRTALNARRPAARDVGASAAGAIAISGADPELALLKNRHQKEFKEAFHAALAELTARERTLLKLHLVDGVTTDKLGRMYQVDKSTVSRWITRARSQVVEVARAALGRRLKLPSGELASLMKLVRSDLDLSLERVLAPPARS
jgi:RNA polymerase sigma-70 factor, ECF subfamily